ncbi:hypothetical protein [Streptomyces albicerus]|uniref:hypothetical protein n=1 Tax=Streptomyces albicerus TaxID=2569859 RepID=UPI00124AE45A|nr:hypothetical protein [Streptomyces albicerus]
MRDDLPAWGGAIQAHGEQEAFAIHDADELVLRTESGQERTFTVNGGDLETGVLRIVGNEGPPFDD